MLQKVRHTTGIQQSLVAAGATPLAYTACGFIAGEWNTDRIHGLPHPRSLLVDGSLHAAVLPQGMGVYLIFAAPGIEVAIDPRSIVSAGFVGRGLNKAVEVTLRTDTGELATYSFQGPRNRLRAVFGHSGIAI